MGQRFEGRSLEEALQTAAATLGAERYQLSYHVVVEKRGFLGGVKRLVIEASVNTDAAPPAPQPALRERSDTAARPERRSREGRGGNRNFERGGGTRERRGRDGRGGRSGNRSPEDPPATFSYEDVSDVPAPDQGEQSDAARRVSEWAAELFSLSGLRLVGRTEETDEAIHLRLYGADTRRLTDRDGELLDSIQIIVNKALGRLLEKPVELDCGSFKGERVEAIGRRAREAAELVRQDGREQVLPAMSPIERRIVHVTLQDEPDVTTESRGDGFFKRVAVIPRITDQDLGS